MRHAKTERDAPSGRDFDRALTERGWSDAERVGAELRDRGFAIDYAVCSPAVRAAETLTAVQRGYGEISSTYAPAIYEAGVADLIEVIRDQDDTAGKLLLIGHNPGLQQLVLGLAVAGPLLDRIAEAFPTSAVAVLDLAADRWREIELNAATFTALIIAKDLR